MVKHLKILGVLFVILTLAGCKDSITNPPTPGPPPQPLSLQSVSPTSINRGARNVVIELTGTGFQSEFTVDFGAGVEIVSKEFSDPSHVKATVNANRNATPGPRVITVTRDSETATLESKFSIGDNIPPTAQYTITPPAGTINTTFEFDASASADEDGKITAFQWTFNDGPIIKGKKIQKKFPDIGEVSVKLTVIDDKQSAHIVEKRIEVAENSKPVAAFVVTPSSGYTSTVFAFDASTSVDPDGAIRTYQWTFGDGKKSNGMRTTHKFVDGGEFTVDLKIEDSSGEEDGASRNVKVTFFDVEKAKNEINAVCTGFLRLFDDLEILSAEQIVVGFSRNCAGRAREIAIIEGEQPIVDNASVQLLGDTEVSSINPETARASLTARFYGTYNDGGDYDGVATHNFTMINENGEWKICNFTVVRSLGSESLRMFDSVKK